MDDWAIEFKVIVPVLGARIEERNQLARLWIKRANIGAFVAIAAETGQRQIVGVSLTAMLQRYDMVRLVLMCGCRLG